MASQGSSRPLKPKQLSLEQWEQLKPVIEDLYIRKSQTREEITAYLTEHYAFTPTYVHIHSQLNGIWWPFSQNQFEKAIAKWKLRKYTTKEERDLLMTDGQRIQRKVIVNGRTVDVGERKKRRWERQERRRSYDADNDKADISYSEP